VVRLRHTKVAPTLGTVAHLRAVKGKVVCNTFDSGSKRARVAIRTTVPVAPGIIRGDRYNLSRDAAVNKFRTTAAIERNDGHARNECFQDAVWARGLISKEKEIMPCERVRARRGIKRFADYDVRAAGGGSNKMLKPAVDGAEHG
jgi:hypothetical protein